MPSPQVIFNAFWLVTVKVLNSYNNFISLTWKMKYNISSGWYKFIVTVHSVHSNLAKIHSRLPAEMEFWLVCLGILVLTCQNTSRDSRLLNSYICSTFLCDIRCNRRFHSTESCIFKYQFIRYTDKNKK